MKYLLPIVLFFTGYTSLAQTQACPINSNWSLGNLTHWSANIGVLANQNSAAGNTPYDTNATVGLRTISEYNLGSVTGIQVITSNSTDYWGNFATIPTINGYKYQSSIKLGSTAISRSNGGGLGGYSRNVSYRISVPTSAVSQPYTMTYAYAMVLENGTHNSNQQPLFQATLKVRDSVITCASPKYYLPTRDNADPRGTGATLDTAMAQSEGIFLSKYASPNSNPNNSNPNAEHLYDVWAKGWSEVTFDLSPYRGQIVTLTFEADNCQPGGHFAYAYVALRSDCDGLTISGPLQACRNSDLTYSIPALTGASYQWTIPPDWEVIYGEDSSILKVRVGFQPGQITALEANSCAVLRDTIDVVTTPPTVPGSVSGGKEVCSGANSAVLTLNDYTGSVLSWQSSTDGVNWSSLSVTSPNLTPQNLTATTSYRAVVRNGESCSIDTSTATLMKVDPLTVGGELDPSNMTFCLGQNKDALLTLRGQVGGVKNWQSSPDGVNWTDFSPVVTDSSYNVVGITSSTRFRTIVQSGVCPSKVSDPGAVNLLTARFPEAMAAPADTAICYGAVAPLNAYITLGTTYSWTNTQPLTGQGDGTIDHLSYDIHALATPAVTSYYVLSIQNAGCPNALKDTFLIHVHQKIVVDAGHDTAVVFNQPLQLFATSNDSTANYYSWAPATGLDNPYINNPVAVLGPTIDSVRYLVTAATEVGCAGTASILVKVFKTLPDIFVPSAFDPGGTTNTVFRPIPVGIATFKYFRVYNRYGQLVYSTTQAGRGWDGRVNGRMQGPGTFVWAVEGVSYEGKTVFHKGTVVLVR